MMSSDNWFNQDTNQDFNKENQLDQASIRIFVNKIVYKKRIAEVPICGFSPPRVSATFQLSIPSAQNQSCSYVGHSPLVTMLPKQFL